MIQPVRGTKDLFPEDYYFFDKIIKITQTIAKRYGYLNVQTPIIEHTEVFQRSLGETSDVVSKEMYSFNSMGGESITLRPEFTASIVRAVISGGYVQSIPLKLFTYGPLFRYDRPQAGRQRQFHQINFEHIGENSPEADAEIIKLASDILENLNIRAHTRLHVNSLGCVESRELYHIKLREYLAKYENELSNDSQKRLHKNPMRILDSKNENDQKILENAPIISEFYTYESKARFEKTLDMLTKLGVDYFIDTKLVRGLDYYCHTAFEFTTEKLGSQATVIGGGRYDGLAKIMSKYDFPAIGFAGGIERLVLLYSLINSEDRPLLSNINKHIAIVPVEEDQIKESYILAAILRNHDISCVVYQNGKMGKKIEKASSAGAKAAIFIGENEIKTSIYKLKNLDSGIQEDIASNEMLQKCKSIMS